tara:strand:+ start:4357 stop:5349 length:993 start_codon:yes stop_codon:yes gene_type:complete
VIIVDGSNNTQREWMDENSNENIQYFHRKTTFPERLKQAGKLLKTKYAILLSDDEFYSVDALNKCINFLESNNEYVAVNGRAVGFLYKNDKLVGEAVYAKWAERKRTEEDPKERMILHMTDYANPLGVSVIKSSLWCKCANLYADNEFPIFAQWELLMNLILSFAGKSKTLDILMYFRSFEDDSPPIPNITKNHIPSLNLKNKIYKIWFNSRYEKLKMNFINVTSNFLFSLRPEVGLNNCKNALIKSLDNFVISRINNENKNILSKIYYIILKLIKNIKKFIIKLLFKVEIYKYKSLADVIKLLEKQGVNVNHKDLNQITFALNFSKRNK